jgi:hypothetical protein
METNVLDERLRFVSDYESVHQRIRPASPQENGQHERMHRELKRETTQPAVRSVPPTPPTPATQSR